jgi:hypothetical protein
VHCFDSGVFSIEACQLALVDDCLRIEALSDVVNYSPENDLTLHLVGYGEMEPVVMC